MEALPADGRVRVLYCFGIARGIDLAIAGEALSDARRTTFRHKSAFPAREVVAPPARVSWRVDPVPVGGAVTADEVEVALYDFGAVAITWTLPTTADLEGLVDTSVALYENEELKARSRAVADEVASTIGAATERPRTVALVEDYVIFELSSARHAAEALASEHRGLVARILRAEPEELSEQEIDDALGAAVSYTRDELVLVDWLSAILVGGDMDDERLLLELATVELLELRVLDEQLDRETREAYALLARRRGPIASWTTQRRELETVARAQADDALMHERIDNALKLFGDDYLARLYRVAADRFDFDAFDTAVQRKLDTLRGIYESLADQASHRRSEVLEWIIIVLIAIDIVIYFFEP